MSSCWIAHAQSSLWLLGAFQLLQTRNQCLFSIQSWQLQFTLYSPHDDLWYYMNSKWKQQFLFLLNLSDFIFILEKNYFNYYIWFLSALLWRSLKDFLKSHWLPSWKNIMSVHLLCIITVQCLVSIRLKWQ